MKKRLLFVSLFLIGLVFLSGCVQQSPATLDTSYCSGEEFTWTMRTSSIFYDSEGNSHVVRLLNVYRDYATFKIDGTSSGIGGTYGDPVYYDFNNNGANDVSLSALSYSPRRGELDVCLELIEENFGPCQGIEMIWTDELLPSSIGKGWHFEDVYENTHYIEWINIYPREEFVSMELDGHSWGLNEYEPNCIDPADNSNIGYGCMRILEYYHASTLNEENRIKICLEETIWPEGNGNY